MTELSEMNRSELQATIRRLQQRVDGLQQQVEMYSSTDTGCLIQEVNELRVWKSQAEQQIYELKISSAMTQGLVFLMAFGLLALLGEKFSVVLASVPEMIDEKRKEEIKEKLGEAITELVTQIQAIDTMSREAWEKRRQILERRAASLPQPKRALFYALNEFAAPSKIGTQLLETLVQVGEIDEKLAEDQWECLDIIAAMLDDVSNLWPLAPVNSLVPLMQFVGWDDAAEAAGEIIDSLEREEDFPRKLVHRVKKDLVEMGVIREQTKAETIHILLVDGHKLTQLGKSPAQAAGLIEASERNLKRAKRTYQGLLEVFNRPSGYPDEDDLTILKLFSQKAADELRERLLEEFEETEVFCTISELHNQGQAEELDC
jgi:hypothetical protein